MAKVKDPNLAKASDVKNCDPAMRVSVGDPANTDIKTKGIKVRGTGAATKGVTARGPMG